MAAEGSGGGCSAAVDESLLEALRAAVTERLASDRVGSAMAAAETLVGLSERVDDLVLYLRALGRAGEHSRVVAAVRRRRLAARHPLFRLLCTRSLVALGNCDEVCALLERAAEFEAAAAADRSGRRLTDAERARLDQLALELHVDSEQQLLLGRAYLQMDNRAQAAAQLCLALRRDPLCIEAVDLMQREGLLNDQDERAALLSDLTFDGGGGGGGGGVGLGRFCRQLYSSRLLDSPPVAADGALRVAMTQLEKSDPATLSCQAQRLYDQAYFGEAFALTDKICRQAEFDTRCIPTHIALLVELGRSSELFQLAHRLVDDFPENSLSWYAVGCYYYVIGRYDAAKKYLAKSAGMRPPCAIAWLAFGHSFAAEQEHDQAMNCYLKAAKVLSGQPLPLLYVGLEYSLTNNWVLADKFLQEARRLAPADPSVQHELGVLAFGQADYDAADAHFRAALQLVDARRRRQPFPERFEPLLNNLAHTARRLGRLDDAIDFHRRSLALRPRQAGTLAALGLCHLLKADVDAALRHLHSSLSLKPDGVVRPLLQKALALLDAHPWLWPVGALPWTAAPLPPLCLPAQSSPAAAAAFRQPLVESLLTDDSDDIEMEL